MKKLGFGAIGIILVAVIYYFTAGSAQITQEMKVRVNTELTMIEQNGFTVQEREIKEKEEHFVLSFDDPEKIRKFFKKQGSELALEDAKALSGLKIGVDLKYLNDTYSALSVELYPLNLPPAMINDPDLDASDKAFIVQLNDMLKRKALLVHVDFNKMLSSFKGFVKDIDETFSVETAVTLTLKGATFKGTIKDDRINTLVQHIKNISILAGDELDIKLSKLKSDYVLTGKSLYDSTYKYSIENIHISGKQDTDTFSITLKSIEGDNETAVKNDLASTKIKLNIADLTFMENDQKTRLIHTVFSFDVSGLDMKILKELENIDIENEEETNKLIQALISSGVTMEIPAFEVKKLEYKGEEMDGFSLTSSFEVNKSANFAAIQANPFTALGAVNAKTKIVLSEVLFTLIAQDPRAMMLAMIIQPQVVNGKKVYEVELKDGKLTVNGKPML